MYVREILLYILLQNKNLTETVIALNKVVNIIVYHLEDTEKYKENLHFTQWKLL